MLADRAQEVVKFCPALSLVFSIERLLRKSSGHVKLDLAFVDLVSGLSRDTVIQVLTSIVLNRLISLLFHKDEPVLCINADKHVVHVFLSRTVAVRESF